MSAELSFVAEESGDYGMVILQTDDMPPIPADTDGGNDDISCAPVLLHEWLSVMRMRNHMFRAFAQQSFPVRKIVCLVVVIGALYLGLSARAVMEHYSEETASVTHVQDEQVQTQCSVPVLNVPTLDVHFRINDYTLKHRVKIFPLTSVVVQRLGHQFSIELDESGLFSISVANDNIRPGGCSTILNIDGAKLAIVNRMGGHPDADYYIDGAVLVQYRWGFLTSPSRLFYNTGSLNDVEDATSFSYLLEPSSLAARGFLSDNDDTLVLAVTFSISGSAVVSVMSNDERLQTIAIDIQETEKQPLHDDDLGVA